jgi:hypothetical protein
MPYQVIYSSASTTPLQQEDLEDILNQARSNNARAGITGALAYVDGCFLQVLEGEAAAVQRLMGRIATDLRHETVIVLQAGEIAAPAFPDWQMAYVSATAAQIAEWAGLSVKTALPETLDALRRDREKTMQVSKSILAMLMDEVAPDEPGG